jgi:hypothetical protein
MPRVPTRGLRALPWGRVVILLQAVRSAWSRLTPAERRRAAELARKLSRNRRLARDELRELRRMAAKGAGW